jgi:hypothetical protein
MSPIPLDFGVLDVCTQVPILINPFAIGPVTAFFNATLTNTAGTAVIGNIGSSGEDGATVSPLTPTTTGIRVDTELISLLLTGRVADDSRLGERKRTGEPTPRNHSPATWSHNNERGG